MSKWTAVDDAPGAVVDKGVVEQYHVDVVVDLLDSKQVLEVIGRY